MDDLTSKIVENTKDLNNDQRRVFIVRTNGEEHRATSRSGVAQIFFPIDGQMCQISEMMGKIIINDGIATGTGTGTNPCTNWKAGTNLFPTLADWKARYPLGSLVDVDCYFGCQCWDYAAAFWWGQVNRKLETGNGFAWGTWELQRQVNLGTEFEAITDFGKIEPGDWVVVGTVGTGHIALTVSTPANGFYGPYVEVWEQNGALNNAPGGGSPVQQNAIYLSANKNQAGNFLGAFRYKKWHTT